MQNEFEDVLQFLFGSPHTEIKHDISFFEEWN